MAKGKLVSVRHTKSPHLYLSRPSETGTLEMSFLGTVMTLEDIRAGEVYLPSGSMLYFEFPERYYESSNMLPEWMIDWKLNPRNFTFSMLDKRRRQSPVLEFEVVPYEIGRGGEVRWPHPEDNYIRSAPMEFMPFIRKEVVINSIPRQIR